LNKLVACAILIVLIGVSLRSMLIDKRQAEVKLACEHAMVRRAGQTPSETAPEAKTALLIQVNDEQQTCHPRRPDE
jgi:hypothetical protein